MMSIFTLRFIRGIPKKILYYSDARLFFRISMISLMIFLRTSFFSCKALIALADSKKGKKTKVGTEKIIRYVHLFLRLRKKLGFKETCLTYSILLCRILREFGLDAKINFAGKKSETLSTDTLPISGHCWVSLNGENETGDWNLIFQYP